MSNKPNPGSPEALEKGCLCPQEDNKFGMGVYIQLKDGKKAFWINSQCPLHGENDERD